MTADGPLTTDPADEPRQAWAGRWLRRRPPIVLLVAGTATVAAAAGWWLAGDRRAAAPEAAGAPEIAARIDTTPAEVADRVAAAEARQRQLLSQSLDPLRTELGAIAARLAAVETATAGVGQLDDRVESLAGEVAAVASRPETTPAAPGDAAALQSVVARVDALEAAFKAQPAANRQAGADGEADATTAASLPSSLPSVPDVLPPRPPRPRTAAASPRRPAPSLPFTVLSVDHWQGEPQLTLAAGSPTFLRPDDAYAGWRLAGGDAGRGTFTMRTPGGQLADYAVGSARPLPPPPAPMAGLTVTTTPADARVRVMNIVPRYQPGMLLPAGVYDIVVDAPGHAPWRDWISTDGTDRRVHVALKAGE
jgi:hypothetical protein